MWWIMMMFGFIVAITPSLAYGVWNGMSLLGLCICILSAGFIMKEGFDE